ncbi:MAG TPA: helicase-related protein, partial [Leptospiraceae bacterium]|nr:helicase-related protein [Leptospiraceae bacterium]
MINIPEYPVHSILASLKKKLSDRKDCIVVSPPGSGKSTVLPLELMNEKWTENKKIYLLEPRRMAAKSTSGRMASLLGEKTGERVGYRIRLENRVSSSTKIEVISEGIFTRIIQNDPELKNAALVIFDEFHERNAASDLGLALFLKSREVYETECRLMIMSATLDASSLQKLIPGSEILSAGGKMFPVSVRYIKAEKSLSRDSVLTSVRSAVGLPGDILFFLPGMREIRYAESLVREVMTDTDIEIRILHSEIPASEQEEILRGGGKKKRLILSTNIAETSLTVPGVMTVIDSGLVKQMRYSPSNGMEELVTERISLSSAEQRKGRAGRLSEGTVFRLYSVQEEKEFSEFPEAEILRTDLSAPILESLNYGVGFRELSFLEKIPESKITAAETVLQEIGVLDSARNLTELGRKISRFGIHPRLSAMILRSSEIGLEVQACRLSAVLSEQDVQENEFRFRSDLNLRLERIFRGSSDYRMRKIHSLSEDLLKRTENTKKYDVFHPEKTGLLSAFAYPERIGRKRGGGKFKLASGKLAVCAENDPMTEKEFICAAEITGDGTDNRIRRSAAVQLTDVLKYFGHLIKKEF